MSIVILNSLIKIEKASLVRQMQFLTKNPALSQNPVFKASLYKQRQKLAILLFDLQTLKSNA